ncbi:Glutathione S-transferase 2 [Wickerhamomyces ciferrii]|uniref:Glutathione S-transferase 2 n=1 Tax=Wickerhamomyces ciferrii (strain ATCC 14091 / BCRC 22168 / CBS 111 / JCM 3599 / NBRC 0793 / NRRL Y-1031 F-60-10) TaxID=1206466 RepID=K0KIL6_WICCF|nr:Glutathione S-transferase 2 [Wickerhamomyces ciferrii]CCH41229.1 Glutathione S-transferase 2 [Wickerhamomyces ciferrii]
MIELYSSPTSNGLKITILLEVLGLEYNYHSIDLERKQNHEPWFLELNPSGTIPVIKDTSKSPTKIFSESITIIQYLADEYDIRRQFSYSHNHPLWLEQLQWLMWHAASHEPIQYQLHLYKTFLPSPKTSQGIKDFDYCSDMFENKTRQLFDVMNNRLKHNNGWFVGNCLNIVDIVIFPWIKRAYAGGLGELDDWDELKKWRSKLDGIDSFKRGQLIGVE